MSIEALVQGQVLDIYREEVAGKIKEDQAQKFWEKLVYQMLVKYDGRPASLVNLEIFGEKGTVVADEKMQSALMTRAQISVLIAINVDKRQANNPSLGVRILQVDPVVNCILPTSGNGSVKPATVAVPAGGNKVGDPVAAGDRK